MDQLDSMNVQSPDSGLSINEAAAAPLKETAGWGRFLGIVGFCFIGLIFIGAFFAASIFNNSGLTQQIPGFLFSIMYLLIGALYFFPTYFLFQFSSKIREALKSKDQHTFVEALTNLKSLYKFIGILTIIGLGFYGLVIVGIIIAAALK